MKTRDRFQYLSHVRHRGTEPEYLPHTGTYDSYYHFEPVKKCPYCQAPVENNEEYYDGNSSQWVLENYTRTGGRCFTCLWWYIHVRKRHHTHEAGGSMPQESFSGALLEGAICSFESGLWSEALKWAEKEVNQYRKRLSELAPLEIERLMGEILSQFFKCDVRHVGRTGDGGIDLVLVDADKPVAVQVKHRMSGKKRESVVPVREFVGAMVVEGFTRGLFVTTAEGFTSPAQATAERASRVYAPLSLMSIADIRAMIRNVASSQWEEYQRQWEAPGWKSYKW